MCAECNRKTERIEELEEEVRQLKAELNATDYEAPSELHLTGSQERILGILLRHNRTIPRWRLFEATRELPYTWAKEEQEKLIHTVICKMRQKLGLHGMGIETVYGRGYRLPKHTRQRLLNWHADRPNHSARYAA